MKQLLARSAGSVLLFLMLASVSLWGQDAPADFGPKVGEKVPPFSLYDQSGKERDLASLMGPKGLVVLFSRSADWCAGCKAQLVELQQAQAQFQKAGLALAGITYDSVAILKDFASRKDITFPMLSDPDSAVIRDFGLLNEEATGYQKGIPHPGYFLLDTSGKVREKYFEASYLDGFTANSILARDFPELLEGVAKNVEAPHLKLALRQSDTTGIMGSRITLTAEITLPKNIHVYAPGATGGYIPTVLEVQPGPDYRLRDAHYPASKILYLRAIQEKVPVFEGKFRITQDVVINSDREFMAAVRNGNGKVVNIEGRLKYQACDAKICYPFKEVPVQWTFFAKPLDLQRVPEAIQHK